MTVEFPSHVFKKMGRNIFIEKNRFGEGGIRLEIHTPELSVKGNVEFGSLLPLKYDIMGPFALVPFMECRHSVWSMQHPVNGKVYINGQEYSFINARGYWEGDRGWSFPKEYLWTQCFFQGGSLMLSVADIPVAGMHFTGVIGVVVWRGQEYRLATYLGARAVRIKDGMVRIVQGTWNWSTLLEKSACPLKAPTKGDMVRTIHESAACRAFYRFRKRANYFSFETNQAS